MIRRSRSNSRKGAKDINSKSEIRNSKQIQMIKKHKIPHKLIFVFRFLDLRVSFVSDFELRISDFSLVRAGIDAMNDKRRVC
jgi:hypothetical protein